MRRQRAHEHSEQQAVETFTDNATSLREMVAGLPEDANLWRACIVIAAKSHDGVRSPDEILQAVMAAINERFFS